jgi:hypothetical protein
MAHRVLVVATAPHPEDELRERVRRDAGEGADLLVVAPASDLSFLQWLASDEDAARARAEHRARRAAEAATTAGRVIDTRVGDADPLVAVEDALRRFDADELVVVTRPEEAATWLEEDAARAALEQYFGRPVTHLVDDDVDRGEAARKPRLPGRLEEVAREIARGQSPWTGFLVLNAVFATVATVAALLIAIALILYFMR